MALWTRTSTQYQEESQGALILSEVNSCIALALMQDQFKGTYRYPCSHSCIAVNPYDTHGTAKIIYQDDVSAGDSQLVCETSFIHHRPEVDMEGWDGNGNRGPVGLECKDRYACPLAAGVSALLWNDLVANDADLNQHSTADDKLAECIDGA